MSESSQGGPNPSRCCEASPRGSPAHDLEVVQVSDCGGGGVCIGEVCEAITLWFPRLRVHHKTEFGNRASGAEDVFDLFLRKVIRDISQEHTLPGPLWSHFDAFVNFE